MRWAIERSEAKNEPDSIVFIIDGGNHIARAIAIYSDQNTIANLEFINFAGEEVILIAGPPYRLPCQLMIRVIG